MTNVYGDENFEIHTFIVFNQKHLHCNNENIKKYHFQKKKKEIERKERKKHETIFDNEIHKIVTRSHFT